MRTNTHERDTFDRMNRGASSHQLEQPRHQVYLNAPRAKITNGGEQLWYGGAGKGDHHALYVKPLDYLS